MERKESEANTGGNVSVVRRARQVVVQRIGHSMAFGKGHLTRKEGGQDVSTRAAPNEDRQAYRGEVDAVGHIADSVDVGNRSARPFVDDDGALVVHLHASVLQAQASGMRYAARGVQHHLDIKQVTMSSIANLRTRNERHTSPVTVWPLSKWQT